MPGPPGIPGPPGMGCAMAVLATPAATRAPAAMRAIQRQEPELANVIVITSMRIGSDWILEVRRVGAWSPP
jgi:hypothetical protein